MGIRSRLTRESLGKMDDDEFDAFLDDVAELGLQKACEARILTMGATLAWIADDDKRSALYQRALMIRAEIAVHESREIVDGATPEDVSVRKLRRDQRNWEASKWNRERYGERTTVDRGNVVAIDAGLVGLAGELLARLAAPAPRVIEHERLVAQREQEGDAGEVVRERESVAPREQHGTPPPDSPPRPASDDVSYAPI